MAVADSVMAPEENTLTIRSLAGYLEAGKTTSQSNNLSFMHRPPTITPNYGKTCKIGRRLKTNIPRVLLYDNVTQDSILGTQISGIQSQRYRARRQLEMAIKSFLQQKHRKDEARRKLTKVHHGEDYAQFEQEYFGFSRNNDPKPTMSKSMKSLILPRIEAEIPGIVTSHSRGTEEGKLSSQNMMFKEALWNGNNKTFSSYIVENEGKYDSINLSFLNNSLSDTLAFKDVTSNSSLLEYASCRKRRAHLAKHFPAIITNTPSSEVRARSIIITEHDQSTSSEINKTDTETSNTELNQTINNIGRPTAERGESKAFPKIKSKANKLKTDPMKLPILDCRFELLQKSLVPQNPPNEGFTELSPSFTKPNRFQCLKEKLIFLVRDDDCSLETIKGDRLGEP